MRFDRSPGRAFITDALCKGLRSSWAQGDTPLRPICWPRIPAKGPFAPKAKPIYFSRPMKSKTIPDRCGKLPILRLGYVADV